MLFGDSNVLATEPNVKATWPLALWRLDEVKRGVRRVEILDSAGSVSSTQSSNVRSFVL